MELNNNNSSKNFLLTLDEKLFEKLFFEFYTPLCRYCLKFVGIPETSEEIVQEVFTYLWEKRDFIDIRFSYKSYLYTSVKNKSLDYLKSKYAKLSFSNENTLKNQPTSINPSIIAEEKELNCILIQAIDSLPLRCNTIFRLSRFSGLSNKEIAEELKISVKTVENQMTTALKKIKAYLEKFWGPISVLFICYLQSFL